MRKIPTMFKRNPYKLSEILPEINPDCGWVFAGEGVATRKYDGSCCMIDPADFWKRREVKPNKVLPPDFILEQEDPVTGKRVGWVPVDRGDTGDRYHWEAFDSASEILLDGTYELCGPKVQGNPEGYSYHVLIKHSDAERLGDVPRTFDGLRDYLDGMNIEGIVFHNPDGRMAKIKKRDFGQQRLDSQPET